MADIIQWARVQDLSPVVSSLDWPERSYMYLERVPTTWLEGDERHNGVRLEWLNRNEDWNTWERGRLFCAAFELRWEKLGETFHAVYVGAPVTLASFAGVSEPDLAGACCAERHYALWGGRVPDKDRVSAGLEEKGGMQAFFELKVPQVRYYPVAAAAQQVRLCVCEYLDPQGGALLGYRFQGLEELG